MGNARWDWCEVARRVAHLSPGKVASIVLDLVGLDHLLLMDSDCEAQLLVECAQSDPSGVWAEVIGRVSDGDWRVGMSVHGWFTSSLPAELVLGWVDDLPERGRLVAGLVRSSDDDNFRTEPRSEPIAPERLAVELITRFPDDKDIWSSLAADFQSGSWTGPWSGRLRHQLDLLETWRADETLSKHFKAWTQQMTESLERQLVEVLDREAEEHF